MPASSDHEPFLEGSQPCQSAKMAPKRHFPLKEYAIHISAITVVVILLWANFTEQYWKDYSPQDTGIRNELKGFQFASKAHELLMLASLSFILLYHMRRLLRSRKGIPFGLVGVTYSLSPSLLLNLQYWRGLPAHYVYGVFLGITCLISVILGPASAITMIPALGWYRLWGQNVDFVFSSHPWPSLFDNGTLSYEGCPQNPFQLSPDCPTAGYTDLRRWWTVLKVSTNNDDLSFDSRYTLARRRPAFADHLGVTSNASFSERSYYATTVTIVAEITGTLLGSLSQIEDDGLYKPAFPKWSTATTTPTRQPAVHVNCCLTRVEDFRSAGNISFPPIGSPWADDVEYQKDPVYVEYDKQLWDNGKNQTIFSWYKDARDIASSSILALASVRDTRGPVVVACSIDARWAASDAYISLNNSPLISSNTSDSLLESLRHTTGTEHEAIIAKYGLSKDPIDIQLEWAEKLNRKYTVPSSKEQASLNKTENAIETFLTDMSPARAQVDAFVATLLGLIVSDSISRTVNYTNAPLTSIDTHSPIGSRNHTGNTGSEPGHQPSPDDKNGYIMRAVVDRYGYGFALRGVSSKFGTAALLLYVVIVLGQMAYVLTMYCTQRNKIHLPSDSWDSVGDMLALGVGSTPPEMLRDDDKDGAKRAVDWRSMVKVRKNKDQHLELQFS